MAIIAVAGGTGQMGRAVVDALIASGKHKTIILSRKVSMLRSCMVITRVLRP
jgi:uncharacterized protein YbjT (DUF2867 family)